MKIRKLSEKLMIETTTAWSNNLSPETQTRLNNIDTAANGGFKSIEVNCEKCNRFITTIDEGDQTDKKCYICSSREVFPF